MQHSMRQRLALERRKWLEVNRSLLRCSPENRLRSQRQRSDDLMRSAQRSIHVHLRSKRARLAGLGLQLSAVDPLAILARGYAMLTDPDSGAVVSKAADATSGRRLRAQVSDGTFAVRVDGT
jgi:exodeoxyribonuclease VII large subunit